MKRVLGLLVAVILLSSCDDGDLIFEDINFDDVTAKKCDNKIYKLNDSEAIILKIGESENDDSFLSAFPTEPTAIGQPKNIEINNTTNKVVYRLYNGEVADNNICGSIPAAFPTIIEEWEATSGTIQITTTDIAVANSAAGFEGGTKITGYQNNIIFKNITFQKADGTTQVYDEFPFGVYEKTVSPLTFNFGDSALAKCLSSNIIFKNVGVEAFTINLDPALMDSTAIGVVKTGIVTADLNAVTYYLFPSSTTINADLLCSGTPTIAPRQKWVGVNGEENFSGIVEVTASALPGGNGFSYAIRLKKLTLKKDRNEFLLADDYLFGELIVIN